MNVTAADTGFVWLLCGLSLAFLITGIMEHYRARSERIRTRIEIDYVRRCKRSEKKLKQISDDAWEKLQAAAKATDERLDAKHTKFWSEFAVAYGKATGHVFPDPPPQIFATKIPTKGSA